MSNNKKQVDISETKCPNCGCNIKVSIPEVLDSYQECVKALIKAERIIQLRENQLIELGFKFDGE